MLKKLFSPGYIDYLEVTGDFKIIDASFGVRLFADCPNEGVKGKDIRACFPETIGLEDVLMDIIQGRKNSFELKGISRSSSCKESRYFDLYIVRNSCEDSLGDRLLVCFKDVTDKMLVEQEFAQKLQEESLFVEANMVDKDYFNQIIDSLACPLLVTTPAGLIKIVNRAARNLLGYEEAELRHRPISKIICDRGFLHRVNDCDFLDRNLTLKNIEMTCKTKIGREITVTFSCSAIRTDGDEFKGLIYIGRENADSIVLNFEF
jgi:PAS domain S-box-containing protein